MWTREKAITWVQKHQFIATDGNFEHIVMDGDGRNLYEAMGDFNNDLSSEELGKLLVFVFNDYIKLVGE
jgi:hypothetical protein